MRELLDGTKPETLGHVFEGSQESCEELTDLVLQSANGQAICEQGERDYGVILDIDTETRDKHGLNAATSALFYITDGDPQDSECELRELTAEDAKRITNDSLSVATQRIVEHYRSKPVNDGHPAYRLYELATAHTKRVLEGRTG